MTEVLSANTSQESSYIYKTFIIDLIHDVSESYQLLDGQATWLSHRILLNSLPSKLKYFLKYLLHSEFTFSAFLNRSGSTALLYVKQR